jgi:epoxide hydrolase 4
MPHPLIKPSKFPISQILKSWYILFFQLNGISEAGVRADNFGFFRRLFHKMDYSRDDMERLLESYQKDKNAVTRMLNWYRYFVRYEIPNRTVPKKMIDVPFKLIWGINDVAIHEDLGPLSVDKSLCSNAELVQINGTHFVQHSNPKEVNEEILKFIKK